MQARFISSLFAATLTLLPAWSHADEVRFDVLRAYALADGKAVAVAIPGEWQELSKSMVLKEHSSLRFLDESGQPVEIPAAALKRASARKSLFWAEEYRRSHQAASTPR